MVDKKYGDSILPDVDRITRRKVRHYLEKPVPGRSFGDVVDIGGKAVEIVVEGAIIGTESQQEQKREELEGRADGQMRLLSIEPAYGEIYAIMVDPDFTRDSSKPGSMRYVLTFIQTSALTLRTLADIISVPSEQLTGSLMGDRLIQETIAPASEVLSWQEFAISTVVSAGTPDLSGPTQRRMFYAAGRFWVFYSNGTDMGYKTSTDAISWSSFTSIRACTTTNKFSIWFDGTYVHYAYSQGAASQALYYRRGTPQSDGTISWSAAEQTALSGSADWAYMRPVVCVDSGGYPWVLYYYEDPATDYSVRVTKSSTNAGVWNQASGFPYTLYSSGAVNEGYSHHGVLVPLTATKMYAIYASDVLTKLRGKLWNGSAWGAQEDASTSQHLSSSYLCAVGIGDDVHLGFPHKTTYDLIYRMRTGSTGLWDSEVTITSDPTGYAVPAMGKNGSDLWYMWGHYPTSGSLYLKKKVGGVWDGNPTTLLTGETNLQVTWMVAYYETNGGELCLAWIVGTGSPYTLRHMTLL